MVPAALSSTDRVTAAVVYALTGLGGLALMLYPLWRPAAQGASGSMYGPGAPMVLAILVAVCFVAVAFEASAGGLGARTVAALGVLVAINSTLRLIEVAVPGPGGFTPVFFLVVLAGHVFGSRFGLLLGALTMAVSAVITGGVGPWLPYQMLAAGWIGLTAGWLPGGGRARAAPARRQIAMLAVFGGLWGFGYGLLMTPWSWQYIGGPAGATGWRGFLAYYLATSLAWDVFAAGGTALLIVVAGGPVVGALRRLGRWFDFRRVPEARVRGLVAAEGAGEVAGQPVVCARADGRVVAPGPASDDHSVGAPALAAGQPVAPARSDGRVAAPAAASADDFVSAPAPAAGAGVDSLHPHAWLIWALAAAALASLTRNPLVLLGACAAVAAVAGATAKPVGHAAAPPLARLALVIVPVAAIYNMLSAHHGETVIARLPDTWPLVGGPITAEALLYGVANGLSLVVLIAAFAVLARALPTRALVRLVPRAFGALALAGAIAIGYLPSVRRQLVEIREAQAVRGLRSTGTRAWIALLLPLLTGSLERSVSLAESLTARGLAPPVAAPPLAARIAVPGGVALLLFGWLGAATGQAPATVVIALAVAGAVVTVSALLALGRRAQITPFRHTPWRWSDSMVASAAVAPLVVGLLVPAARDALAYQPFPQLTVPPLDALLAISLFGLAVPVAARAWSIAGTGGKTPAMPLAEHPADRTTAPPVTKGVVTDPPGRNVAAVPATSRPAWWCAAFGYTYPDADGPVLAGVDLALPAGGMTLLVGPSGVGKSTLLRAGNGLVPHFTGGTVRGAIAVAGRDPVALGPAAMSDAVGFVSGDPERGFVMDTVADEVAFALEQRGLPRAEMARRVAWALGQVNLDACADRALASLSGGERQRVALAAALALAPAVLVLDEPTSQIDDACAEAVLSAVVALARRRGLTVIVSEHRIDRVTAYATTMVHLAALATPPTVGPVAAMRAGLADQVAPPAPEPALGPEVLTCDGLHFAYNGRAVLRDASLRVRAGEVVALMGPSGAGKTTLLRLAVGLIRPTRGELRLAGQSIAGRPVAEICRRVGYLPQDPNALLFAPTVRDEMHVTLAYHAVPDDRSALVEPLLADLGIADLAERYPRDLSTGQRQRVALAAVAVTRPEVLLLDEPTRGLDDAAIAALASTLHGLAAAGAGILVATHDWRLARAAHRIVRLTGGRID